MTKPERCKMVSPENQIDFRKESKMGKELVRIVCVFLVFFLGAWMEPGHSARGAEEGADWDEQSTELLSKVTESNLDMTTVLRFIRSASCTINLTISTPGAFPVSARMSYSWEDSDDDGMLTDAEVEIETESLSDPNMRFMMSGIHQSLRRMTTLSARSFLADYSCKTQRVSGGYQMTLKPKAGEEGTLQLTVSNDFRITKLRIKTPDGTESVTSYTHQKARDKWLVKSAAVTTTAAGRAFSTQEQWALTHEWQEGMPLLSGVTITSTVATVMGTVQTQQQYTLSDWKVVKRGQPLEPLGVAAVKEEVAPAGQEVRVPKTEEAKKLAQDVFSQLNKSYYGLASSDVAGFEATYAVEKDGESLGTMKASWSRGDEEVSTTMEEAEEDAIKEKVKGFGGNIHTAVVAGGEVLAREEGSVYGVKSDNQYIIDLTEEAVKEIKELKAFVLFVSRDFREIRVLMISKDGVILENVNRGEEAGGTNFIRSSTSTAQKGGKVIATSENTYTYTRKEGTPFLKRLVQKESSGGEVQNWTLVLQDVTFRRGAVPAELEKGEEEKDIEAERQLRIKELEDIAEKALREEMEKLRRETEKSAPE